jgi:hypothetical protein
MGARKSSLSQTTASRKWDNASYLMVSLRKQGGLVLAFALIANLIAICEIGYKRPSFAMQYFHPESQTLHAGGLFRDDLAWTHIIPVHIRRHGMT